MASLAQLTANRSNSLKSTGPTSVAGKAVSRFNALKSGIDAKSLVIPGEDAAELQALATNYQLQFLPGSPVEQFLVDTLTHADWKLRRLRKREAQLLHPAPGDSVNENLLYRLDRQITAAERSYFRALKELLRQIPARIENELAELEARVGQTVSPANPAPGSNPAPEIGFVPSETESMPQTAALGQPKAVSAAPTARREEPKINLALRL
jgi:hypothetical protein